MYRIPALLLIFATIVSTANAAPIIASPTGLASPDSTVTFSEVALANGTLITNQFAAYGVTFAGAYMNPQGGFITPPNAGNFQQPDGPTVFSNPFSIFFNTPQEAAAFEYLSNPGTTLFEARLNGNLVESFSTATALSPLFYGFQSIVFDEIRVTAPLSTNQAALFDTIQLQAAEVPEPASLALWSLISVAGLAAWRRRKLANAVAA